METIATDSRVRRVVILGGGTAGWMTAAALSKTFGPRLAITLLESEDIGTVGVGEATIPTIHWFNELIGLNEAEFLRETKATFKLGIEFVGWARPDHRYFHPFGVYGIEQPGVAFHHRWLKAQREGSPRPLTDFSLATQLAAQNRFAKPVSDPGSILSTLGYAYHFDASLYARHLRGLCEAAGVRRVEGKLERIEHDTASGHVAQLWTEQGEALDGELFIDCSGFRALLIGGENGIGVRKLGALAAVRPRLCGAVRASGGDDAVHAGNRARRRVAVADRAPAPHRQRLLLFERVRRRRRGGGDPARQPRRGGARRAAAAEVRGRAPGRGLVGQRRCDRACGGVPRAARIDQHSPDPERHRQAADAVPRPRYRSPAGGALQCADGGGL